VHVFVFNKHGDVYLQKRSHLKDVHPRMWDSSAAGHLDVGESYAVCALREAKEELGIQLDTTTKAADIPATDLNPAMVSWAADRISGATWLPADAQFLDFPDGSFDLGRVS